MLIMTQGHNKWFYQITIFHISDISQPLSSQSKNNAKTAGLGKSDG